MTIANHTTKVPVAKTVAEISELLVRHGARSVNIEYEQMEAKSVAFEIVRPDLRMRYVLPCDWRATLAILNKGRRHHQLLADDQARRVAWRVIRDWLRAQLALIEIGCAKLDQVMLPYAVTSNGESVYQRMLSVEARSLLALPPVNSGGAA